MKTVTELRLMILQYVTVEWTESVEHFLLECQLHSKYRNIMYEDINEVLQLRKESLHVKISLGLLLGYQWEDGVGKSQDSKIKRSVFQFIASTGRKL